MIDKDDNQKDNNQIKDLLINFRDWEVFFKILLAVPQSSNPD